MLDECIFLSWFRWDVLSMEKAILWIWTQKPQKQWFEVKIALIMNLFFINMHKKINNKKKLFLSNPLIDGLESCGLFVDYCDVFISGLNSHTDGTHSLQRIHWWRIKLIYILDGLRAFSCVLTNISVLKITFSSHLSIFFWRIQFL